MRTIALAVAALIALPVVAQAETSVSINIGLPVAAPRLVVVSPGVQVVPEFDEEVFFTDGFYWVRRDAVWYRSRVHTGGWVVVPGRAVPARLVKIPPGHYRNWKEAKQERKEQRRAEKRQEHFEKHGGHKGHGKH
jgi:hypothetical protein